MGLKQKPWYGFLRAYGCNPIEGRCIGMTQPKAQLQASVAIMFEGQISLTGILWVTAALHGCEPACVTTDIETGSVLGKVLADSSACMSMPFTVIE